MPPRPATLLGLALSLALVNGCGLLLDTDPRGDGDNGGGPVVRLPHCDEPPDDATVALFRMDDLLTGVLTDATGAHDGAFRDAAPQETEGPVGCGMAWLTGSPIAAVVPSSADFRLRRGAVDLWAKLAADRAPRCDALVSRDAGFQDAAGHFTLHGSASGRIGFRLQGSPVDRGAVFLFSDEPVPLATWVHLGVNFGPDGVALYIDGVRQMNDDPEGCGDRTESCTGDDCTTSIEGNDNPWVVGAGSLGSSEGTADRIGDHFSGALDELRISSTHRDFAGAGL